MGEKGEQLGIMAQVQALDTARKRSLDLVEVAPTAVPPVCRLMDYGKYRYEQAKKDRESRKG
ncbi:MAG: translation initiation factor IF-3, partial [Dehalococcoidales bacterium]